MRYTAALIGTATAFLAISQADAAPIQDAANGKWYEVFDGRATWEDAEAAANALANPQNGAYGNGYLAVIANQQENDFISGLLPATGGMRQYDYFWIGGHEDTSNETWHWVNGSLNGDVFWQGDAGQPGTGPRNGYYTNMNPSQPDDFGGIEEDALVIGGHNFASGWYGTWGDAPGAGPNSPLVGYVVEWDGVSPVPLPGALSLLSFGLVGIGAMRRRRPA